MLVECPSCHRRHEVDQRSEQYDFTCECSERMTVLPWLSYRQPVTRPEDAVCSVCQRRFDLGQYRNETQIACACGNVLEVHVQRIASRGTGRRRSDQTPMQLQARLHGLVDTCRLIHVVRDTDKLLMLIVRVTTEMLDSEGCSVILRDPERRDLVFHSVSGATSTSLSRFRLAEGEGVAGTSIQTRQSIVSNDVARDPRFSRRADDATGFSTRNLVCIPLMVEDACIGALEIVNKHGGADFTDEDLILAQAVSNQIAIAIRNVQLTEAALKAERLAAVGQAVTGVAHCVKNMLSGLDGGLYVLRADLEEACTNPSERGFDMLARNIERLKGLVQDMLSYAKDGRPDYAPVDLNELVATVIELMTPRAAETRTQLSFSPDPAVGKILVDQKGVYRSVLNLVTNAIDACEETGAAVTVSTRAVPGHALIQVADCGEGMDEQTVRSIFQPFYSRKGAKGTGLGLSVTQKIIREHGGRIEVKSTSGRGSTFTIYLPAKKRMENG